MDFKIFGKEGAPSLMLIPGLGVSYEIFLPLIGILEDKFHIIAVQVDGFTLGKHTEFTSVDDQARQVIDYIQKNLDAQLDVAYGLSLGGKILSQVLELNKVQIKHAIMDAAPLLPLPRWLVSPLKYLQCANVWTCYHWTGFWRWVFHSHYFDVLLDECKKIYPFGGSKAVLDGYTSVYTTKLESISGNDIHFWYGSKEAFVAKPQVKHLKNLCPNAVVEIFKGMNHGQLLTDHPEEVATRIIKCSSDILETKRLIFRPWGESDAEELFLLASDPDVGPRAGWQPHSSAEHSLEIINTVLNSDHIWALVLKETGQLVGCMGYYDHTESNIGIAEGEAEVGYWIGKPYWNHGYCTEALRAMIDYCFNTKGFLTLWADHFVDNPASGRVMEKCGFRDTGKVNWLSELYKGDERPVKIMRLDFKRTFYTRLS